MIYRYFLAILLMLIAVCVVAFALVSSSTTVSPVISPFVSEFFPTPTNEPGWSLLITGDIIPARVVNQRMVEMNDFEWPTRQIQDILKKADITLIDLEAPILERCPITNEGFKFCGDKRFISALLRSGVDVANLANNHSLNYGWEGIKETQEILYNEGILTTGFNAIPAKDTPSCNQSSTCSSFSTTTVQGVTLGFLGYNAVGQRMDEKTIQREIQHADKLVDVLIVSVHWGKEYERFPVADPSLAPDDPVIWGKKFVDWGADIVAGNHPHWYQSMKWYREGHNDPKVVFYALGNTVFDQEWSQETKEGVLVRLHFAGKHIQKDATEFIPIGIKNYGEAYLMEGQKKEEIVSFYKTFMSGE